jgi:type I restriction enzyme S subunit
MLRKEFPPCTLDDLADFRHGKSLSPSLYSSRGSHPVFGSNGQIARSDEVLNERPSVVIGRVGAYCGSVYAIREPAWVTDNAIIAEPKPDVDFSYLYYCLRALDLNRTAIGSAQPLLTQGGLRVVPAVKPPYAEQQAIGGILSALDDKIELNLRMNETLETMARAIFKSWFVDFDPVRVKAEGRNSGLPKLVADLFPARIVDSEFGEIPEGWEVGSIYDIANVVYGAPFASAQFNAEGIGEPLIRIRDLASESPGIWTSEVHPKGYSVKRGDIVVGMDGEFRAHLWGGAKAWLNQRVCAFVPRDGYSAAFVRNSIIAPLAQVEATETATTVIHLGKNDIDRFSVLVPKGPVLALFNEACQPWYGRIVALKSESRTLAAVRDALLPKLLSGEIRTLPSSGAASHA